MKKATAGYMTTPICCSDKGNVIESKIDPHSVVKSGSDQKRWNFYKRNKNRKKVLVDQAEQCNEDDIQKCLSDDVLAEQNQQQQRKDKTDLDMNER